MDDSRVKVWQWRPREINEFEDELPPVHQRYVEMYNLSDSAKMEIEM